MSTIQQWATVICLAALVGTMVEILTPIGSMEKMVRFVLGAFMLCAIITPLVGTAQKINYSIQQPDVNTSSITVFQNQLDGQLNSVASEKIKALAAEILQKESINAQKIDVFMDTSQNNSISIIKVTVYLNAKDVYKKERAKQLLEDNLGLSTEIITEQG